MSAGVLDNVDMLIHEARQLGVEPSGILLGYRNYAYLWELSKLALISDLVEEEVKQKIVEDTKSGSMNYSGIPIMVSSKPDAVELLYSNDTDGIKMYAHEQLVQKIVMSQSTNVVPFKKKL